MMRSYTIFGFTRPVIEATIDHTRGENASHYNTYKTKQQYNINKKITVWNIYIVILYCLVVNLSS